MRLCDFSTFVCSSCFGTGMRCRDSGKQDKHVPCSLCSMSLLACPCAATVSINFPFSQTREAREAPEIRDTASIFFFNFFALCPRAFDAPLLLGLSARILKMFIFSMKVNVTTRNFAKILCDLNTT